MCENAKDLVGEVCLGAWPHAENRKRDVVAQPCHFTLQNQSETHSTRSLSSDVGIQQKTAKNYAKKSERDELQTCEILNIHTGLLHQNYCMLGNKSKIRLGFGRSHLKWTFNDRQDE